jgi:hypothetical protein
MFLLLFLFDDRRIRIQIRISDKWIRMRIREARKHIFGMPVVLGRRWYEVK